MLDERALNHAYNWMHDQYPRVSKELLFATETLCRKFYERHGVGELFPEYREYTPELDAALIGLMEALGTSSMMIFPARECRYLLFVQLVHEAVVKMTDVLCRAGL